MTAHANTGYNNPAWWTYEAHSFLCSQVKLPISPALAILPRARPPCQWQGGLFSCINWNFRAVRKLLACALHGRGYQGLLEVVNGVAP